MVVNDDVVRRGADSHLATIAAQLYEVGVDGRQVELEELDIVVLLPVDALPLQTVGPAMTFLRGLAGARHVPEPDLALSLAVAVAGLELRLALGSLGGGRLFFGIAAEVHLEHRRQ